MHFIGKYIDRTRAEARDTELQYREASSAGKQKLLDAYREELMKEARVQVKKAQDAMAKASDREKERFAYLSKMKYVFLNGNTHGNANIKYIAVADELRSTARPLAPAPPCAASAPPHAHSGSSTDLV